MQAKSKELEDQDQSKFFQSGDHGQFTVFSQAYIPSQSLGPPKPGCSLCTPRLQCPRRTGQPTAKSGDIID
jgi:hypothetical protein